MMRKIRFTVAIGLLSLALPLSVSAGTDDSPRKEESGSITIRYKSDAEILSGASFCIIQTAVISDSADKSFQLAEPFKKMELSDPARISDCSATAATEFYQYAEENRLQSDASQYTDQTGSANFSDLDQGVYLIYQSGSRSGSMADAYDPASPFMVSIPMEVGSDKTPVYDVIAYPKTAKKSSEAQVPDDEKTTSEQKNGQGSSASGNSGQESSGSSGNNGQESSTIGYTTDKENTPGSQTSDPGSSGGQTGGSGHNTSGGSQTTIDSVNTGDHSGILFYISVAAAAIVLLIGLSFYARRRGDE